MEYVEFLFLEIPHKETVIARSGSFLAPVITVWHFCPLGTPTQNAGKQVSA